MTQTRWSPYIGLAAGTGVIAIVLTWTSAGPALAQTFKPVMSFITNDASNPIPVRVVASSLTRAGRPVSDLVQLQWSPPLVCFTQTAPSFDNFESCYVPDTGRTLVITDVQWEMFVPDHTPGFSMPLALHAPSAPLRFGILDAQPVDDPARPSLRPPSLVDTSVRMSGGTVGPRC